MIVFDFIYFCIYSFVPDKAIFGKRDVACTFLTIFTSIPLMVLWIMTTRLLGYQPSNTKLYAGIIVGTLLGGGFVLTRMIFLRPIKFKNMHRRFRRVPKWLLKTIGISYILFCFFGSMFLSILTTKIIG